MSPYVAQALARARLDIIVSPLKGDRDGWYIGGDDCCMVAATTRAARAAYVQLRDRMEAGHE